MLKLTIGVKEVVNKTLMAIDELRNSPGTVYVHKDNELLRCNVVPRYQTVTNKIIVKVICKIRRSYLTCWKLTFNIEN